mmetsp:Transcript_128515/g.333152  ORF Transcript_128515/g.333152 Transcript_128515/m.333152 type:complete len:285 (-) Transcript_128515:671-1525(-)
MPRSPKPPGTKMPCAALKRASQSWTRCRALSSLPSGSSKSVASTHWMLSFRPISIAAWCRAAMTDWYASLPPLLYFPTKAITTSSEESAASTCLANLLQSSSDRKPLSLFANVDRRVSRRSSPRTPLSRPTMCCSARTLGTWNKLFTSCAPRMRAAGMLHWLAIFFFVDSSRGRALRQTMTSGCTPSASKAFAECCVGLVFWPLMSGTYEQWTHARERSSKLNLSWRSASMNGMDSISPTVPPSSIMQICGRSVLPSTGTCAARSIHSTIAPVMCGITCTVLPK